MKTDAQDAKDAKGLDPKDTSPGGDLIKSKLGEGWRDGEDLGGDHGAEDDEAMEVARVDKEGLSSGNPNTVNRAANILQDAMTLGRGHGDDR